MNSGKTHYIGLVGTNGSGKTTACTYLKTKGFHVISLSDFVREEVQKKSLPLDRDTLIQTANSLKDTHGQDYLAKKAHSSSSHPQVVFDSIRNLAEIHYLQTFGTQFLGFDAPIEVRYNRIKKRKSERDPLHFNTFVLQDETEFSGKSSGQNLKESLNACEFVIMNIGSLTDFYTKINNFLEQHHAA